MEILTTESFNVLIQKVNEFEISENYFSDILSGQVAAFTLIVVLFSGISWLANLIQYKNRVKKEVKKTMDEYKNESEKNIEEKYKKISKDLENKYKEIDKKIDSNHKTNTSRMKFLEANLDRSYGYFISKIGTQEALKVALGWYISSAQKFSLLGYSKLTREVLNSIIDVVKKINGNPFTDADDQDKFWNYFYEIDDKYRVEKESLETEIKTAKTRLS